MKGNGRQLHAKQSHVLNENGVDTGLVELMDEPLGSGEFVVVDNRIDGDEHLSGKAVGMLAELTDVVDAVACCRTGPKALSTNVDGISTMIDGCHAALQILGRCQQF